MSDGQLWLFPPPKPLVERFGKRVLSPTAGATRLVSHVQRAGRGALRGEREELKKRLAAYRVSNPERFSRRIIRLLNEVRRIEFDVCASEACARDREEQLICTLLPKFNRAGKVWRK